MLPEILEQLHADELLQRQDALQLEAKEVIAELGILVSLARVGIPEQFGSSITGLMVWRDLDFSVITPDLPMKQAIEILQPLLAHPDVIGMQYLNEHGVRNPTGKPVDDRYFFALFYEKERSKKWKIDISFWLTDTAHDELGQLQEMFSRYLTEETRLTILWIKDVWHHFPSYPYEVSGMDIYTAVLEHNIKTPLEFESYLAKQGRPMNY